MREDTMLSAAGHGDENACAELVNLHYDTIYRFLYRRTGSADNAEDICQEVFLRFFRSLPTYREDGKLRSYLFTIAIHAANDFFRKQSGSPSAAEQSEDFDPSAQPQELLERSEKAQCVKAAIEKLPVYQRDVILLRFYHDLPFREIARITQTNPSFILPLFFCHRRAVAVVQQSLPGAGSVRGRRLDSVLLLPLRCGQLLSVGVDFARNAALGLTFCGVCFLRPFRGALCKKPLFGRSLCFMELTFDRVSKQYGHKIAVDRFSTTMTKGVYGLLGPNGSGKTTLLRMVADVLRPTGGEILLNGSDIHTLDEKYRDIIGYLPQRFGFYRSFTAMDFLLYLAAVKGIEKRPAKEKARAVLETVGLESVAEQKIRTFSGGMQQRLGIAQSLLNDPEILLLDEPTAGLDPKERIRFRNLISDISEDRLVLLSTHIVSDVAYIAERILFLKKGCLLHEGTTAQISALAEGRVWSALVPPETAGRLKEKHVIANLRHLDTGVELRILADEKPTEDAIPVPPSLEDAYLYCFREEMNP